MLLQSNRLIRYHQIGKMILLKMEKLQFGMEKLKILTLYPKKLLKNKSVQNVVYNLVKMLQKQIIILVLPALCYRMLIVSQESLKIHNQYQFTIHKNHCHQTKK